MSKLQYRASRSTDGAGPMRRWAWIVPALAALWALGSAGWIHAKAELAQWLLQHAWEQTLAGREAVRPWPWADTWPVARLHLPGGVAPLLVLQGDSGRTLAFGPGMAAGSIVWGSMLISGHRDTHFAGLQHVRDGDVLVLETPEETLYYRVAQRMVMDSRHTRIVQQQDHRQLLLLTCYPFHDVMPGGPLRFLVQAEVIQDPSPSET